MVADIHTFFMSWKRWSRWLGVDLDAAAAISPCTFSIWRRRTGNNICSFMLKSSEFMQKNFMHYQKNPANFII